MSKYYITRDRFGPLSIFTEKPTKDLRDGVWKPNFGLHHKDCNMDILFPEVRWEDEEPKILTVLKNE